MGKSADPPDPVSTARAQGESNDTTARLNARLNRGNTFTPFGSVTNTDMGAEWVGQELARRRASYDGVQWRDVPIFSEGTMVPGGENGDMSLVGGGQQIGSRREMVEGTAFDEGATRAELEGANPYRDQWRTDVQLSERQQRLFDLDERTSITTSEAAMEAAGRLRSLLGTSMDLSGMPELWGINPSELPAMRTGIGGAGEGIQAEVGPNDFSADRLRVEQALMDRMAPGQARDREALEARMAAQGVSLGTEAYGSAMDDFGRSVSDARLGAIEQAGQEQQRLFGMDLSRGQFRNAAQGQAFGQRAQDATFANGAREQALGEQQAISGWASRTRAQMLAERLQMRTQPINEVAALFGLGSGITVPTAAQLTPTASQSGDVAGATQANYQARAQQAGQANQSAAQAAAAAAMIAAMSFSDRRLKEDARRVGELDNGLPVYAYRYKSGGPTQIGVMAQDVEEENPGAVGNLFGFKMVNYDEAVRKGSRR